MPPVQIGLAVLTFARACLFPGLQDASASKASASGTDAERDTNFAYAKLAIFCSDRRTAASGVSELSALSGSGYKPSESAFWLAVGQMETGSFAAARSTLASLVRADPANERAAALLEIFKQRVWREGKRGLLLVGGGALLAVALAVGLIWWRNSAAAAKKDLSAVVLSSAAAAHGSDSWVAGRRGVGGAGGSTGSSSGYGSSGSSSGGSSSGWRSRY